jgi:hypothetical protein
MLTMTADRIMHTAFWVVRLMANMTLSLGLCSAMSALLRGLPLRHGKVLQGYSRDEMFWRAPCVAGALRSHTY